LLLSDGRESAGMNSKKPVAFALHTRDAVLIEGRSRNKAGVDS
jgi:hypothetical protein